MICDAPGEFNGGTWGSDGTIIFHQTEFGLREVSAQGGDSQPLAIPGAKSATVGSGFPAYLPDGQSFLNFVVREDGIGELVVDSGETSYTAVLMVGIASITGRYDARVTLADRVEPESYRLVVDAKGRPGFVRGEAHIKLADGTDGQTVVSVDGRGQIGGMIARVGQRLVGTVGKTMMDRFFDCLSNKASAVSS